MVNTKYDINNDFWQADSPKDDHDQFHIVLLIIRFYDNA